eukprot:TRINITY_DN3683_c0_g2_i1.p1 TRINITY_DN3683_c0_g2~~TRINITY_DN3683_c0_g2_i1.p1  ORF type:complete len:523 (-),score=143.77 TRINITY_DN3683_c0_g2_i1:55-1599(-)
MSFAVKLADLDDFINPSQSCVKPLITGKTTTTTASDDDSKAVKIEYEQSTQFSQIKASSGQTAKITLNDCLACSGCVTSAETMLVQQQSLQALLEILQQKQEKKKHIVVATVAMQSCASIAARLAVDIRTVWNRVRTTFKKLGVDYVFDASFAWDLALLEARQEFVERFRIRECLPLLCGECPGWVCYAEKMQHESLKHISKVRSPQQILGVLVKHYMSEKLRIDAENIYHFAVAPCFDKKLEASREADFGKDVDLVIATTELFELLESQTNEDEYLGDEKQESRVDSVPSFNFSNFENNQLIRSSLWDAGSGGYAEHIFRYAAKEIFGVEIRSDEPLQFTFNKKNPDLQEVELVIDGEVKLRFAKAYGFRNIQNLVRKLKNPKMFGTKKYDYVEVMACPSGCLNGGGQLRAEVVSSSGAGVRFSIKNQRELTDKIDSMFHDTQLVIQRDPADNEAVREIYDSWLISGNSVGSDKARQLFHTSFHAVAPLESLSKSEDPAEDSNIPSSSLAIKW